MASAQTPSLGYRRVQALVGGGKFVDPGTSIEAIISGFEAYVAVKALVGANAFVRGGKAFVISSGALVGVMVVCGAGAYVAVKALVGAHALTIFTSVLSG